MLRTRLSLVRFSFPQSTLRRCFTRGSEARRPTCNGALPNTCHWSLLRHNSNGSDASKGSAAMEEIAPEMVTIEILPVEGDYPLQTDGDCDRSGGSSHNSRGSDGTTGGVDVASKRMQQQQYWDVTSIDHFSKSRVLNYVRRTGNQSANVFDISEEQMFGKTVYRARCKLPLPAPHHLYLAEGVGEDERDAVLLAAMHAERVCDALGVPLFRLPLMQKKHADNARRQGRYAPIPGDPIKPENTITPPPLRMVSVPNCQAKSEVKQVFSSSIAEAEIISDDGPPGVRSSYAAGRKRESVRTAAPASGSTLPTAVADNKKKEEEIEEDMDGGSSETLYHTTVHYPWLTPSGREGIGDGVTGTVAGSMSIPPASAAFDPTEGGLWQMVNTTSTRCSPSPDALLLPCVYEAAAHGRMKDHFLQQGMSLKDRVTFTHVAVANHSTRMYVAELFLHDTVVARGKAQTKECAEHLAAMHGELLLDALARPLFPQDPERQARHAEAVARFGRWAPNPKTGDLQHPRLHDVLPLPLKQQVGGDDVWMDPMVLRRCGYQRSMSERMISSHIEINNYCGDYIEANPDPALLEEARRALEVWQRDVARNPHPDLFVITRMGDQFRASTLLPVPKEFGIRGGNGVGKTMEQAMDLCALHAVDTLCALGVPLFTNRKKQEAFVEARRKRGLVTADVMGGLKQKNGLVAIIAPSLRSEGDTASANASVGCAVAAGGSDRVKKERPPYLPGYMVEGNQPRPLPHICDTLRILQLRIPEDFTVYGEGLTDESIIEVGNEAKVCVQNYLRQHLPKNANVNASVYITGYGRQVSVHNIAYLPLVLPRRREGAVGRGKVVGEDTSTKNSTPSVAKTADGELKERKESKGAEGAATTSLCVAGKTGSEEVESSQVHSGGTQDGVENPKERGEPTERLLAIGISLKKKDAERVCYLHAVDILRKNGVDVLSTYRAGLPRRKGLQSPTQSPSTAGEETRGGGGGAVADVATSTKPMVKCNEECKKPQTGGESGQPPALPKPYMHKLMKNFMESGKHYTPPKRRSSPSPHSPF